MEYWYGTNSGTILNVLTYGDSYQGGSALGGIVGENSGKIILCNNYAEVKINGTTGNISGICAINYKTGQIMYCRNFSTIKKTEWYAAGIVVENRGLVKACGNEGNISVSFIGAGGIACINVGAIEECYNKGNITTGWHTSAGIACANGGSVKNCYNVGNISGVNSIFYSLIAGEYANHLKYKGTCENAYALTQRRATYNQATKNVYTVAQNLGGIYRTDEELKSAEQITLLNEGNVEEVWVKDTANINNGYPILKWQLEK